jgi:hypothetical protein
MIVAFYKPLNINNLTQFTYKKSAISYMENIGAFTDMFGMFHLSF